MPTDTPHSAAARLLRALPEPEFPCEDQDRGCRGALALLMTRTLEAGSHPHPSPRGESFAQRDSVSMCPNCGRPCDSDRSPYCSDACKEQSAIVRQIRSNLASGAIFNEERQIAFGEKLWRILGGGYPRRTARLTDKQRAKIFVREGGKCQSCGAPAVTIDHCGSG